MENVMIEQKENAPKHSIIVDDNVADPHVGVQLSDNGHVCVWCDGIDGDLNYDPKSDTDTPSEFSGFKQDYINAIVPTLKDHYCNLLINSGIDRVIRPDLIESDSEYMGVSENECWQFQVPYGNGNTPALKAVDFVLKLIGEADMKVVQGKSRTTSDSGENYHYCEFPYIDIDE